jgi:hypothetical protein
MTQFVTVESPGGVIWVEIEQDDEVDNLTLSSTQERALSSFQEATKALKSNAQYILKNLEDISPDKVEISFGIKVGAEAGSPFFCLAKASGEANYSVKITWKNTTSNQEQD